VYIYYQTFCFDEFEPLILLLNERPRVRSRMTDNICDIDTHATDL